MSNDKIHNDVIGIYQYFDDKKVLISGEYGSGMNHKIIVDNIILGEIEVTEGRNNIDEIIKPIELILLCQRKLYLELKKSVETSKKQVIIWFLEKENFVMLYENNVDMEKDDIISEFNISVSNIKDQEYVYSTDSYTTKMCKFGVFYVQEISSREDRISYLITNLSRELRNPLNSIIGILSLLMDSELGKKESEYLSMIRESSYQLMGTVSDLLEYFDIEKDNVKLDRKTQDLKKTIDSCVKMVEHEIKKKKLKFKYSIDSDVPQKITTDHEKLKQIIINLLLNAVKFTDEGFIKIKVKYDEPTLSISIADSGMGISKKYHKMIFRPFVQLDNKNKINRGMGLGLTIADKLSAMIDGNILINSDEDIGSTFTLNMKIDDVINVERLVSSFTNKLAMIVDSNNDNKIFISRLFDDWEMAIPILCNTFEEISLYKKHFTEIDIVFVSDAENQATKILNKLKKKNIPIISIYPNDHKIYSDCINSLTEEEIYRICSKYLINNEYNILVVEDIYINQKVIVGYLNKAGYKNIDAVDNGKKALDKLREKKYHIMLLDIKMPVMSGIEVCKHIVEENIHKPYIIGLSACDKKETLKECPVIDNYLIKPIIYSDLIDIICKVAPL